MRVSHDILILDGGMSRELVAFGATLRQPEWSGLALIEQPEIVEKVHRVFIEAGADIVTTNSYALVPFHIGQERFDRDATMLADRAGRLARAAADAFPERRVQVAGSLPPLFGSYEPENFDAALAPSYLGRLVPGLAPHVDLWLGETLSLIAEGQAVCDAVAASGKPVWISFTLDEESAGHGTPKLRSGETVKAAAEWLAQSPAVAMLFNCSQPEIMAEAVGVAAAVLGSARPDVRIGVYANAFEVKADDEVANETLTELRGDLEPRRYAGMAAEWVEKGASIVGGCCGIGHEHIHCVREAFPG